MLENRFFEEMFILLLGEGKKSDSLDQRLPKFSERVFMYTKVKKFVQFDYIYRLLKNIIDGR